MKTYNVPKVTDKDIAAMFDDECSLCGEVMDGNHIGNCQGRTPKDTSDAWFCIKAITFFAVVGLAIIGLIQVCNHAHDIGAWIWGNL